MKRIFLLCVVSMVAFVSSAYAQTLQEVVYLKNGSILRGIIIEQTPGVSIKLQTGDNNIWVFQVDEISKITKEGIVKHNAPTKSPRYTQNSNQYTGYRGFVDESITFHFNYPFEDVYRYDLTTSHGYQFSDRFFLGGGLGLCYYWESNYDDDIYGMPIFAHIKYNILSSKITPYIDTKIGYTFFDIKGLYFSPTIGCRFGITRKLGINFGLSYTYQMSAYDVVVDYDKGSLLYTNTFGMALRGLSFRLGIEF